MSLLVGETSQVFQTPGRPDFQVKAAVHKESNQFRMTLLGFLGNGGREIPRLNYNDRFGGEASIEPKMAVQWWRGGCRNCTVQRNHEENQGGGGGGTRFVFFFGRGDLKLMGEQKHVLASCSKSSKPHFIGCIPNS